jgi:hypothetical protein
MEHSAHIRREERRKDGVRVPVWLKPSSDWNR